MKHLPMFVWNLFSEANPPPIPEDVYDVLPPEGLVFDISFTIFAN